MTDKEMSAELDRRIAEIKPNAPYCPYSDLRQQFQTELDICELAKDGIKWREQFDNGEWPGIKHKMISREELVKRFPDRKD